MLITIKLIQTRALSFSFLNWCRGADYQLSIVLTSENKNLLEEFRQKINTVGINDVKSNHVNTIANLIKRENNPLDANTARQFSFDLLIKFTTSESAILHMQTLLSDYKEKMTANTELKDKLTLKTNYNNQLIFELDEANQSVLSLTKILASQFEDTCKTINNKIDQQQKQVQEQADFKH